MNGDTTKVGSITELRTIDQQPGARTVQQDQTGD